MPYSKWRLFCHGLDVLLITEVCDNERIVHYGNMCYEPIYWQILSYNSLTMLFKIFTSLLIKI